MGYKIIMGYITYWLLTNITWEIYNKEMGIIRMYAVERRIRVKNSII